MNRESPDVLTFIATSLQDGSTTYQQLAQDCDSRFGTDFGTGESMRKFAKRRSLRPKDLGVDVKGAVERERERIVAQAERRELIHQLRGQAKAEIVHDAIIAAISALPPLEPVRYLPVPALETFGSEEVVLIISDSHVGYWMTRSRSSGLWEYDFDTFRTYVHLIVEKVRSIIPRHNYRLPVLHIHFLGDIVENAIMRRGQVWEIEFGIKDQCMRAAQQFVWMIRELLTMFERVECVGLPGNHGRMSEKFGDLPPGESFDLIVYEFIRLTLAGEPRFSMEIVEAERHVTEICGWRVMLTHGADIRGGFAGIPYYGVDRHNTNVSALFDDLGDGIDTVEMGHFHQAVDLPFRTWGRCFMNGSFTGATMFSLNRMQKASQPIQWLYGVNEERPVTWTYKLCLAEPRKRVA